MESASGATVMFEKSSRMRRVAILGASALAAWLFLGFLRPDTHAFSSDQNTYLAGAAALKAGHGYRFEPYIGLPRIGIYPPGFSIWLALFWKAGEPFAVNLHRLEVANWIADILDANGSEEAVNRTRAKVEQICRKFPVYAAK